MSGGKGGKSSKGPSMQQQLAAQQQAIAMARPKDVQLQTTGWGGMGPNLPQNPMQMGTAITGQGLAPPAWATGDWAMPWWGQQAPNVGAAMMQQQDPAAWAKMVQGMQGMQGMQGPSAHPDKTFGQMQPQGPLLTMGKARKRELIARALQSGQYETQPQLGDYIPQG